MLHPACLGTAALLSFLLTTATAANWHSVAVKFPDSDTAPDPNITAIGISRPDRVYIAASDSRLYLWNGKTLEEIEHDESGDSDWKIRNIIVNDVDDIWALGDNGLSLKFDGESWQAVRNPLTGTGKVRGRLWAAGCADANLCFAASQSGRVIRWDGRRWEEISSPVYDARIYGMQLASPEFGWMVGDGFFASWDGKQWTKAGLDKVPRMYGVALVGRDWGWAVGDRGVFFRYDGNAWTRAEVKGSLFRLRSISCSGKTECWAVGEAGAVFRWNGTDWQRVRVGTFNRLTTVKIAPGKKLIGGDQATVLEFAQ